jgi:hypothetical protein
MRIVPKWGEYMSLLQVQFSKSGIEFKHREHVWNGMKHYIVEVENDNTVRICNGLANILGCSLGEGLPTMISGGKAVMFDGCDASTAFTFENTVRTGRTMAFESLQEMLKKN